MVHRIISQNKQKIMTNAYSLPDYKERYFEYKELQRVHGKPTLDKIIKVWRQLKRNAQRIPTLLGGGNHGYLALLLIPTDYINTPGTQAFNRPTHPGIFRPIGSRGTVAMGVRTRTGRGPGAAGAGAIQPPTSTEITIQKAIYDDNLRQYNEVQCVETLLRNQFINAFDHQYLDALRDSNDMINLPIHSIMSYIIRTHGQISEEQYMRMEDEVRNFIYEPNLPVDILFNNIDFFVDISELTKRTITDRRQIQMAYLIFNRAGVFRDSLKTWNARPDNLKTYDALKVFMRDEHAALDMVGALTIQDSSLQHANMLQALQIQQDDLADKFQRNLLTAFDSYAQSEQENIPPNSSSPEHQVSDDISRMISNMSSKSDSTEKSMISMLQKMMNKMNELETKVNNGGKPDKKTLTSTSKVNPKTGKAWKRYCWTCGCCDHWGKFCTIPAQGHKNEANFKDRMNGSKENVLGE